MLLGVLIFWYFECGQAFESPAIKEQQFCCHYAQLLLLLGVMFCWPGTCCGLADCRCDFWVWNLYIELDK